MEAFLGQLNAIIWSSALIYLCLGSGLYFSVRTKFLQVRHFRHMLSIMREGRSSDSGVSSFQALAMSLSGRVGTGNIVGLLRFNHFRNELPKRQMSPAHS